MKQYGMHQMFGNLHKGTTSTKKDKDKVRTVPHKAITKVTTKCCYSCGEECRIPSDLPKKRERFPTFAVKYEEEELRELLELAKPKKKKKCPNPSKQHII